MVKRKWQQAGLIIIKTEQAEAEKEAGVFIHKAESNNQDSAHARDVGFMRKSKLA